MNRGEIPGYYYDAEKKKYFRIQANHVAPPNARHARSNVNEERREQKKQKIDHAHEAERRKQTVTLAKVLQLPLLSGRGLLREQGTPRRQHVLSQDHALVSHLEPFTTTVDIPETRSGDARLIDAQYLPQTGDMVVAACVAPNAYALYSYKSPSAFATNTISQGKQLHCFPSHISSLSTATFSDLSFAVACCFQPSGIGYNLFVTNVGSNVIIDDDTDQIFRCSSLVKLGTSHTTVWSCKINPVQPTFAVTSSEAVYILGLHIVNPTNHFPFRDPPADCLAVEWLTEQTLAFEYSPKHPSRSHAVHLWDLRSQGSAARLNRSHRITALARPAADSHSLLVASARSIDLYDLRMAGRASPKSAAAADTRPLFSIPHLSAGAQLGLAVSGTAGDGGAGGLLAAVDAQDRVRLYSLRDGGRAIGGDGGGVLGMRGTEGRGRWGGRGEAMRNPHWYEDERGAPFLQACCGPVVRSWAWQGRRGGDEGVEERG